MPAMRRTLGVGKKMFKAGKAISNVPGVRKTGLGLLFGGAAVAGIIAGSKSIFDSAQDVAFDDPEADRKFTGQDFGPGFYASQAIGGPIGAIGRAASPLGAGGRAKAAFMTRSRRSCRDCCWSFCFSRRFWGFAE